jgi:hypothetical protein
VIDRFALTLAALEEGLRRFHRRDLLDHSHGRQCISETPSARASARARSMIERGRRIEVEARVSAMGPFRQGRAGAGDADAEPAPGHRAEILQIEG